MMNAYRLYVGSILVDQNDVKINDRVCSCVIHDVVHKDSAFGDYKIQHTYSQDSQT